MQEIDKKTALAAAQIIKDYCCQRACRECVFGEIQFCQIKGGQCPACWQIR